MNLIDLVLDEGTFCSWDRPPDTSYHSAEYRTALSRATSSAGTDEAVVTGSGRVAGRRVALIVSEFRFLAGSIGRAAASRITAAVRRATAEQLPLLAAPSSGGTRMQEGTAAFLSMIDIAQAIVTHRRAGLPYLVHLRHPTTGGAYASWGSLGQLTVAEPGALIGFLGPKVFEGLYGRPFPPGIQRAEHLVDRGVIDAVVRTEELAGLLDHTLAVLCDPPSPARSRSRETSPLGDRSAWSMVELTRRADRIGARDILRSGAQGLVRLGGTGLGERDDSVLIALTRLDGEPCVLVAQDRVKQSASQAMGPGGLRQARRFMALAEELRLPLVTVIDTPGAEVSPDAEERAIAGEIARCLAALSSMSVPTVSVLLGQGTGGGAIALFPARRRIALENAWLAPLPPEGASMIVHGDTAHAPRMAAEQGVRAIDLLRSGAVHELVPEPPDRRNHQVAGTVVAAIGDALRQQRQANDPPIRPLPVATPEWSLFS